MRGISLAETVVAMGVSSIVLGAVFYFMQDTAKFQKEIDMSGILDELEFSLSVKLYTFKGAIGITNMDPKSTFHVIQPDPAPINGVTITNDPLGLRGNYDIARVGNQFLNISDANVISWAEIQSDPSQKMYGNYYRDSFTLKLERENNPDEYLISRCLPRNDFNKELTFEEILGINYVPFLGIPGGIGKKYTMKCCSKTSLQPECSDSDDYTPVIFHIIEDEGTVKGITKYPNEKDVKLVHGAAFNILFKYASYDKARQSGVLMRFYVVGNKCVSEEIEKGHKIDNCDYTRSRSRNFVAESELTNYDISEGLD